MNTPTLWQQLPASGRLFLRFWGGGLGAAAILALSLQVMGPPRHDLEGQDIDVTGNNPADKSARTVFSPRRQPCWPPRTGRGAIPCLYVAPMVRRHGAPMPPLLLTCHQAPPWSPCCWTASLRQTA